MIRTCYYTLSHDTLNSKRTITERLTYNSKGSLNRGSFFISPPYPYHYRMPKYHFDVFLDSPDAKLYWDGRVLELEYERD